MTNKLLEELKASLQPYEFFWDEWAIDENCNLDEQEIALVNSYLATSFEVGVLQKILFYHKARAVKESIRKLSLGYAIFKEFVVVKFLLSIIAMAKQHGYDDFLATPISQLKISKDLKDILMSFKSYTLQQLFIVYKVEDFGRKQIFNKIRQYHILIKEETLVSN